MWYRFASLQDEVEKLRTQGINESILAVFSDPKFDDATKGKMLGAIKQNPNVSLIELKNLSSQNKPTLEEKFILDSFTNRRFKNWLFHKLKSWRIQPPKPNGEYDHNIPSGGMNGEHANFLEQALHMQDFVNNISTNDPDYNLGLKTWEQVVEDTNEWEEILVGKGGGKFYNPADREVVMAYPDGWNMVNVNSENDLDVEGAKMHHCVAGYWDNVRSGTSRIYSLRNPQNQPMVTIEVQGKKVIQIKGPSNAKVTDENLVEKIKDFFDDREDIQKTSDRKNYQEIYFEDWQDRIDWNNYPEEIDNNITYAIYGPDETEYDPYDDDESTEDFNRFGIQSPTWDHKTFAERNLYNADIPDLMKNVVDEINDGISAERNEYRLDSDKLTFEDYPIEDYAETFYEALVDKAELSLRQNSDRYEFEKYLDVNNVLETATKKFEEAKEKYQEFRNNFNEEDIMPSFMGWYEKQPEYIYFLLANKIENFFETSKFALDYEEKTGNIYRLPSGYRKNYYSDDEIVPFIKTQPLLDLLEKQKINDRSQLRLFAPNYETEQNNNQTIDVLTERPMTDKDENWAYAGVYNNKNFRIGN
jgi:hypothetical protein